MLELEFFYNYISDKRKLILIIFVNITIIIKKMIFIRIRTGFYMSLEGIAVGQDKFTYKFSMTVCSTRKIKMFL